MFRYLLLVYILNKNNIKTPISPLFRELSEENTVLYLAEKIWASVKKFIMKSIDILCYKIEPDIVLQFIDITEDAIKDQSCFFSAKV